jgi:hypothetical protein
MEFIDEKVGKQMVGRENFVIKAEWEKLNLKRFFNGNRRLKLAMLNFNFFCFFRPSHKL